MQKQRKIALKVGITLTMGVKSMLDEIALVEESLNIYTIDW